MANNVEIKSISYTANVARAVKDILQDHLREVMEELYTIAARNMAVNPGESAMVKREVEDICRLLRTYHGSLPLHMIVEAFYQGSLGRYGGTVKLSMRNIAIWLREVSEEHRQREERKSRHVGAILKQEPTYPYGAIAIRVKMHWQSSGRIRSEDWDNYPISGICALLRSGKVSEEIKPEEVRI